MPIDWKNLEEQALNIISFFPKVNNTDIAEQLGIDGSLIPYIVRNLARHGLICGTHIDGYYISQKGVKLLKSISKTIDIPAIINKELK